MASECLALTSLDPIETQVCTLSALFFLQLLTWSLSKLRCPMPGLASVFHVSVASRCWWLSVVLTWL